MNELVTALNMPNEKFQETYKKKKPNKDDRLILLCQKGEESHKAVENAKKIGYQKLVVVNFANK